MARHRRRMRLDLARQRIGILFGLSLDAVRRGEYEYARMLVGLIARISRANRARLPRRLKRRICKNCNIPLVPGVTARYRLRRDGARSWLVVRCLLCGWIHRYPYKVRRRGEPEEEKGAGQAG